jgi:hypothetical protein
MPTVKRIWAALIGAKMVNTPLLVDRRITKTAG